MVVNSRAVIAKCVKFSSLRIAVLEEQHQFDVIHGRRFNRKVIDILPVPFALSCTHAGHALLSLSPGSCALVFTLLAA